MKRSKRFMGAVIASAVSLTMFPAFPQSVRASGLTIAEAFPDYNFYLYVSENFNTDGDNYLSDNEAAGVTSLDVSGMGIRSLEGIRYFSDLESLVCSNNSIDSLDLKYNFNLKSVICNNCEIRRISLFNIPNLEYLECYGNNIRLLDVSDNDLLIEAEERASVSDPSLPAGVVKKYYEDSDVPESGTLIYDSGICVYTVSDDQYVINASNFPDDNFRAYVLDQIDLNIDRRLAPDEIYFVEDLDVNRRDIHDMTGAEIFDNMKSLDCSNNPLGELDLSILVGLESVRCNNCGLTQINASNSTLKTLMCFDNELYDLDLSDTLALTGLFCSGNHLTSLSVQQCTKLDYLDYSNNPDLGWVAISGLNDLYTLRCGGTAVENIDLSDLNYGFFHELYCNDLGLTELDLMDYDLTCLDCSGNDLTSIDLSGCSLLWNLKCDNNHISELDFSNNDRLFDLWCYGNDLTELDLSSTPELAATYTDGTRTVNGDLLDIEREFMLNGESFTSYLSIDNNMAVSTTTAPTPAPTGEPSTSPATTPATTPATSPATTPATTPSTTGTPVPTGATVPSTVPTVVPSVQPTTIPAPSVDVPSNIPGGDPVVTPGARRDMTLDGFIGRLYRYTLNREADEGGLQSWRESVIYGTNTGADLARGFLYSPEFINAQTSNEDFVRTLYATCFDREADQGGFEAWVGVLNNGTPKDEVIESFINSTEWANVCLQYGIRSGGTGTPNIEVEPNQATIDFATRLYTTCLNRNADPEGLMAWARQLANQRDTGTGAAWGFFFSSEFTNQNVDNREFVTRLYRTFMGREPDQAGFDEWVAQLDSGVSREEVFNGFSQSREFSVICGQYGIIRE